MKDFVREKKIFTSIFFVLAKVFFLSLRCFQKIQFALSQSSEFDHFV